MITRFVSTRPGTVAVPDSTPKHKAMALDTARRADIRNLAFIVLACLLTVILVPPIREYPINDDWTYFRAVGDLLRWSYTIPDWSQAIALTHVAWGGLFSVFFGYSFTTVTIANLSMGLTGVVVFYLLLRHLDVGPNYALFGAALLGFNPIYFNLSYSFMTDVTFLVCTLTACLFYVRSMKGCGDYWLWLGGVMAALAYLTRQYGIVLVVTALAYLWWARRWTWKRAASIAAIPFLVVLVYTAWEHTQPMQLVLLRVDDLGAVAPKDLLTHMMARLLEISRMLITPGLCLLPLLPFSRLTRYALLPFALVVLVQLSGLQGKGSVLPLSGNVVDHTGFVIGSAFIDPIWNEIAWTGLGVLGLLSASVFATSCAIRLWEWLKVQPWKTRADNPALLLNTFALALTGIVFILVPLLFDRYLLPVLAALIVTVLQRMSQRTLSAGKVPLWRWMLLLPLVLFSIVAERDYMEHTAVRWRLAEQVVAQGVPHRKVYVGYEWTGWYLYKEGAQLILERKHFRNMPFPGDAVLDPEYIVADKGASPDGYIEVKSVPYNSWLEGGQNKQVSVLKRQK